MNALSQIVPIQTNRPEPAALAFAAMLDRIYVAGPDDATEDALCTCAELMGGLGVSFVQTLIDHLDNAEREFADECEGDIGSVRPPNSWEMATVRATAAWTWLEAAQAAMAKVPA